MKNIANMYIPKVMFNLKIPAIIQSFHRSTNQCLLHHRIKLSNLAHNTDPHLQSEKHIDWIVAKVIDTKAEWTNNWGEIVRWLYSNTCSYKPVALCTIILQSPPIRLISHSLQVWCKLDFPWMSTVKNIPYGQRVVVLFCMFKKRGSNVNCYICGNN